MADHNELGKEAENLAAEYLLKNEYKILVRNFRFKKNEVDIIAEKDNLIIVVEVKARSTDFFILPQEAVTKSKIKAIVLAANHFMEEFNKNQEVRLILFRYFPTKTKFYRLQNI